MRVLVACEYSGAVRRAFRALGHDAWSVDLLPSEDNSAHHVVGDALEVLRSQSWDMLIAFPPCQFLTKASARWMHPGGGLCPERYAKMVAARQFFLALLNADVPRVCIENPTPLRICDLPTHTQVVQPWEHGHPHSKRTLLWLKGLFELVPTDVVEDHRPWCPSNTGGARRGQRATRAAARRSDRNKTFSGIARAMADQWGDK
tara:strand:- start:434 stop:1042 length:609 start_codon:yes stop_codon:yes gene_type:complete